MKKNILIPLAFGFEETEAVTIIDVLRRAGFNVTTVSVNGFRKVAGAHHIPIEADKLFEETDFDQADMIILPGGMPGTSNLHAHTGLIEKLQEFYEGGKNIGAICAAPMILGSLGFLKGRKAVCYPGFESKLEGATILNSPFVVDGNIITGRGVGTALEFSLEIVRMFNGADEAANLRTALVIP
jgi:protein deglycase